VSTERIELIRERLRRALNPVSVDIQDESPLHKGHPGARDGRGHFRVTVIASAFESLPRLQRHRLVYEAVGDLMQTDIHALSIDALTPDEAG